MLNYFFNFCPHTVRSSNLEPIKIRCQELSLTQILFCHHFNALFVNLNQKYVHCTYSIIDITLILAKLGFISIRPLYTLYTYIQCACIYNVHTMYIQYKVLCKGLLWSTIGEFHFQKHNRRGCESLYFLAERFRVFQPWLRVVSWASLKFSIFYICFIEINFGKNFEI